MEELVLGWTIPQREAFYGAPTLAARLGFPGVSGPMISQACATSVAAIHAAASSQDGSARGARLVVTTDRTSNGPHVVYPRGTGPGGTVESENWVLDSFERDPVTGESMLATAERVAGEAHFAKEELDELTARRYDQYAEALADDRAFQREWMVPITVDSRRDPVELEAVREHGFATNFGETEDDVAAVAVAVPRQPGMQRAAITVSAPLTRMDQDRVPAVAEAARRAAADLGQPASVRAISDTSIPALTSTVGELVDQLAQPRKE